VPGRHPGDGSSVHCLAVDHAGDRGAPTSEMHRDIGALAHDSVTSDTGA